MNLNQVGHFRTSVRLGYHCLAIAMSTNILPWHESWSSASIAVYKKLQESLEKSVPSKCISFGYSVPNLVSLS